MVKDKEHRRKHAKKRLKELKRRAIKAEKSLDYDKALIFYKRAKKLANKWNIDKNSSISSFKIMQILILNLKIKLKQHLNAINLSENNNDHKKAYDHCKIGLWIAFQLNSIGFEDMNPLIKELEDKISKLKIFFSKRIFMRYYDGRTYETSTSLSKTLELIDFFPTSFEIPDNFIILENGFNQKIHFRQISKNSWYMEIVLSYEILNEFILKFKHLTGNIVKIFTLNFFMGYFIGDYLSKTETISTYYKQTQVIIKKIKEILIKHDKCQFCNNLISNLGQNRCEYCGTEINYEDLLLINLIK